MDRKRHFSMLYDMGTHMPRRILRYVPDMARMGLCARAGFGTRRRLIRLLFCFAMSLAAVYAPAAGAAAGAEKNALRVGVQGARPPLSYTGRHGVISGLAADLARALNTAMGRETVFVPASIPELEAMLEQGEIDYACGIPMLEGEKDGLALIPTSFSLNRRILVANRDIHITAEEDFTGHSIVIVRADAPYARTVRAFGGRVIVAKNTPEALELLRAGKADAHVSSLGEVASSIVQQLRIPDISLMGLSLRRTPVGIMVRGDDAPLAVRLAGELTRMEEAGGLEMLREKWLGRPIFREPGIWERYGRHILYGACAALALLLAAALWNVSLRRRVAAVTHSLRDSEQRYRNLTEASPDMILLADREGLVRFANAAARHGLELPGAGDIPADVLLERLDENGRKGLRELAAEALSGRVAWRELYLRLEGRVVPVELIAVRAMSEGELVCCIGRDVSQRRDMERELARSERLALIGRLAAGVAHEINNPLGIILANADYLLKRSASPQLEAIVRNVERASDITRRLLHLAVDREREDAPLDMAGLVRECLAFLRPRLKKVELALELPERLPARGDRALLEQLLLNLLLNALDSMKDEGRLRIWGRLSKNGDGGGVTLAVEDSGPGIPRENLERIFDVFFSTKGARGFGLGLFVARSIAERHGGLLWAESEEGRGAVMMLELPAGGRAGNARESQTPSFRGGSSMPYSSSL